MTVTVPQLFLSKLKMAAVMSPNMLMTQNINDQLLNPKVIVCC